MTSKAPATDRRRQILDAAIRVFAREGFNACRVSDIAQEANVAYGLVYHYFNSKDQVLNELFVERWSLLLVAIEEADARDIPAREKLDAVAGFIIGSYRHDPELMKVIIIEVTRAANSFTRTHLPEIRKAYALIAKIVRDGQEEGTFRADVDPEFASMWFYGAIVAGCSRSSRTAMATSSGCGRWWWRRSAAGWRLARRTPPADGLLPGSGRVGPTRASSWTTRSSSD